MRHFLPLLGDIALAAHGDATARELAEALLPQMEQRGWRIADAARRIWAGERDADKLTAGLDAQDTRLVRRVLALVAEGPRMIFAASSLQIAHLRSQAEQASAQALRGNDPAARATLAQQFIQAAQQAEQQPGGPWQSLAAHLRGLAERLMRNS
ncbi:MAG: hypothetical protein OHK0022_23780 [Roseiflexaceae bacterium]